MPLLTKTKSTTRRFKFSEDKKIISEFNNEVSIKDIAESLNRTEGSIRARIKALDNDEKFDTEEDLVKYHKERNTYDVEE